MEDTYKGQVDNPLSLNRYIYTANNPLRYIDPSGHTNENAASDTDFWSGVGVSDWNKMSEETKQMYIDRYIDYGPQSIPAGIRDFVAIEADPSLLLPGAGATKIVGKGIGQLANKIKNSTEHVVYTLRDPITNEVKYVGRTLNPYLREAAHKLAQGKEHLVFTLERIRLSYNEARGLEQVLFDKFGGFDKLLNKIKPISDKNPKIKEYIESAKKLFE